MTIKKHLIMKLIVILYSMFIYMIEAKNCNFNIQVQQTLRNEGFHRKLSISIDFSSDNEKERWLYEDCMVGIEQTLPAGVYSSQDEINDNRCKNLIRTIFKTPVNIELPADKSEPIVAHLLTKVKDYQTHIYIPVHARYQQAIAGGGTVRNHIPVPKVYLLCPEKRLDVCDDLYKEVSSMNNFCETQSREVCPWKEIPIIMVTAPLTWDVPVGNSDHYTAVALGTASVITLGSLYLLRTVHEYKIALRRKKRL